MILPISQCRLQFTFSFITISLKSGDSLASHPVAIGCKPSIVVKVSPTGHLLKWQLSPFRKNWTAAYLVLSLNTDFLFLIAPLLLTFALVPHLSCVIASPSEALKNSNGS